MVSRSGVCALSPSLDQVGVLARSVVDASAIFSALCGYDSRDDQSFPSADRFGSTLSGIAQAGEVARMRLGRLDYGAHCDGENAPAIVERFNEISDRLLAAGHRVERSVPPPIGFTDLRHAALLVIETEGYVACQPWLDKADVSESLQKMLGYGARQPASRVEQCRDQLRSARLAWQELCGQYDLLMLPTAPQTSFVHDAPVPASQADFTAPASVAGLPSISLPAGRARDGRYFGLQLIGPPRSETRLLRFAKQIQENINS
jgi:aspartyl-tRNA(Asn)/glutamyl-tRNA(Gln) amidotransferase subunit A